MYHHKVYELPSAITVYHVKTETTPSGLVLNVQPLGLTAVKLAGSDHSPHGHDPNRTTSGLHVVRYDQEPQEPSAPEDLMHSRPPEVTLEAFCLSGIDLWKRLLQGSTLAQPGRVAYSEFRRHTDNRFEHYLAHPDELDAIAAIHRSIPFPEEGSFPGQYL